MSRNRKAPRAPIVGFLAARLDEPYQYSVWCGAVEEARRFGASLVFFGGQRVGSPVGYEALDNIAFDLAARSHLSGLIVMANAIGTYLSRAELSAFLKGFESLPIVSVGVAFADVKSVRVRNEGGMRAVAEHLTRVHCRSRFLFLAGPAGHPESESRKREFLQSLTEFLPDHPAPIILHADFQEDEAKMAVEGFLALGGKLDAVVAANDLMAFGALRALSEAGIDVPRDVSVTGYDDTESSRYSIPPLTTIRQPTRELGREAFRRIAVDLGLEKAREGRNNASISFVIRESCGCPGMAVKDCDRVAPADSDSSVERASSDRSPHDHCAEDCPSPDPASANPADSLAVLSLAVNRELSLGRNPAGLRIPFSDPAIADRAALIVMEGEVRYQAYLRTAAERRTSILREIGSSLISSFDITDILREVARGTQTLGISACWLALFDSPERTPVWARLYLASSGKRVRILAPYGMRFRTMELLPGGLPRTWNSYICEPLRFGEERLGYLVCTGDSSDRRVFEALRDQVSTSIKGALLMAAERDRERKLAQEVRARTVELSATNERLVEEIDRRRTLERELLKISNDIMGSIGRDIHDHLCQDIAGIGLRAALLEGALKRSLNPESREAALSAQEIVRSTGKAVELAKSIARGLYPAELEAKGIVHAVEDLLVSARKRCAATIELEVSQGFSVHDSEKALQLYRITQEALGNAVSHSGAKRIDVGLHRDKEAVTVEVRDDGIGLAPDLSSSSGMGLRIMRYRASVIGGELRIRSHGDGTSVSCRVPY